MTENNVRKVYEKFELILKGVVLCNDERSIDILFDGLDDVARELRDHCNQMMGEPIDPN